MELYEYLKNKDSYVTIDVRSEGEYQCGHIPGAANVPLLENENRKKVGIAYKTNGPYAAVLLGYELVSPQFKSYIKQINKLSEGKPIAVYCARGGLRSSITLQLLKNAGLNAVKINGGYKQFRRWTAEVFKVRKQIYIYGGYTGSRKTEKLLEMKARGFQVIDLEGLANHRGSAFGGIGMDEQPSVEQFENLLAFEWMKIRSDLPVWIEDESRSIGRVYIPEAIYKQMREASLFKIVVPFQDRVSYIVDTYGRLDKTSLAQATRQIARRLGGKRTSQALEALQEDRLSDWAELLLAYYDDQYHFGNGKRSYFTSFECDQSFFDTYLNEAFPKPMFKVIIALGGNLGDVSGNFIKAIQMFKDQVGSVVRESSIYKTQAWGDLNQPDYLNQVVVLLTTRKPFDLLQLLHQIESKLGRERSKETGRNMPRTIDLDILFYGTQVLSLPDLSVPHPRIPERRFILEPLKEVCPQARHPLNSISFSDMLKNCVDTLRVDKL